jgi:membrane protein YqaA with SNARE-associated domain
LESPTYDVDTRAEGAWVVIGTSIGAIVGAIMGALGADTQLTVTVSGAVGAASGAIARWIIGHFLPSAKASP